ncbi:MAG TPA: sulfotransferase [Casimicrobiaceae bacterium]|nr:sulfotransferase [Casimicrobiaceae bacterium]
MTAVLDEIDAAMRRADVARATTLACDALAAGAEHPDLLNLRAFWFEGQGRDAEALADLRRASALAPDSVGIRYALGLAHAKAGRQHEAIACFDSVIARDAGFEPAHLNKGWASEALGDLHTARDCYARSHELKPTDAEPLARMAALAVRAGDWPQARTHAGRALAIDPTHPIAITALAAAERAEGEYAGAESRLKALLARPDLEADPRSYAEGLLGDLLDAQGRTGEAFAVYRAANDALRRFHAPRFEGPGVETMPMVLHWLNELFEKADSTDWAAATSEPFTAAGLPAKHVFMLGFPRSGTTLLEQVLDSHSAVVTSGERQTLDEGAREFLGTPADVRRLARMGGAGLRRSRRVYWENVRQHGIDFAGRVFIDKQPWHTLKLPLIAKLFPTAKIVFSVRDPRDVVLSCFRRRFLMSAPNFQLLTLDGAARLYDSTMRLAELYRAKLPLDLYQLRHEDLVADFEGQVRAACDAIGLTWQDSMRDFAVRARTRGITTPSSVQVMRGLNREGVGHWRRYRDQMEPILPLLRPWVERFGYPPD